LGHGWASMGYTATEIDPKARGVGWLRAEDGIPRRVKAAYLTDEDIIHLAAWAAQARATRAADHPPGDMGGTVISLHGNGKGDAA
jgi:DNA segregation ATPase FtsK/SpoIIIE, S-DNA-T family